MSNNNQEGTAGDTAPTPKRVAKKAAKKVATKTATKKVATKTAVKKVAKKVSAPTPPAESSSTVPMVSSPVSAVQSAPAPRPVRASRAKKVATEQPIAAPTPPESSARPMAEEAPRRFGRVPGGGRTAPRGPEEPRPQAPQDSTPFPQPNAPSPRQPQEQERRERPPHEGQQRNFQSRDDSGPVPSRSKRRRDKRKRRNGDRQDGQHGQAPQPPQGQPNRQRREYGSPPNGGNHFEDRQPVQLSGEKIEADGLLELAPKGFGFLRVPRKNFEQARDDVFVTPETIRKHNLRLGQWIHGLYQEGPRGPQLVEITQINGMPSEEASKLPHFDELKAINPAKRISFETTPERFTTRVVDIMAPVGRGQRGLIVSPPRSGKTTLLLHMAEAIREKYDEAIHLMVVLVDERPEEVTEFRRALPGAEIYASSNDEQARNHTRIAELAIERAKRLVEAGKDVFLIMDSITRLARAYNSGMNNRGRGTGSGGITIGALEVPRRLFAAARNTRGGGSLTIMATALIQTNSRADEAIYMEFKGTGNMELVLDRKIAENYIYPAVDIFKSGTRREELLLPDHMLHKIHLIRRGLSGHRPAEAMERLLFFLKKFPNNPQMLLEIKG